MAEIDVNEDFDVEGFRDDQESKKKSNWVTMKIHPEIFEDLGVRDPEQIKLETAIMKKTRQVKKELRTDPDNLDLQVELGTLYIDGGNYDEAIKMLNVVIQKDNAHGRAHKVLGTAYALSNHEDEAIRTLSRAAELCPPRLFVARYSISKCISSTGMTTSRTTGTSTNDSSGSLLRTHSDAS